MTTDDFTPPERDAYSDLVARYQELERMNARLLPLARFAADWLRDWQEMDRPSLECRVFVDWPLVLQLTEETPT